MAWRSRNRERHASLLRLRGREPTRSACRQPERRESKVMEKLLCIRADPLRKSKKLHSAHRLRPARPRLSGHGPVDGRGVVSLLTGDSDHETRNYPENTDGVDRI